jgi:hypothetical protein
MNYAGKEPVPNSSAATDAGRRHQQDNRTHWAFIGNSPRVSNAQAEVFVNGTGACLDDFSGKPKFVIYKFAAQGKLPGETLKESADFQPDTARKKDDARQPQSSDWPTRKCGGPALDCRDPGDESARYRWRY